MPKPPLPTEYSAVLAKPNPSVMSTLKPDGAPVTVATWYLWDNGRVLINLDEGRKRLDHLRADPRVSITVLDGDQWYRAISLRGRVVSIEDDPEMIHVDRIAIHYTGEPYPDRRRGRISAWIEVDQWHAWGFQ
jgi:PPOX class probable F420-dependent enzyme